MGCFNVWCPLCGIPLNGFFYDEGLETLFTKTEMKKLQWAFKVTILEENKKIVRHAKETGCNIVFETKNRVFYFDTEINNMKYLGVHDDCWDVLVKNNININFTTLKNSVSSIDVDLYTIKRGLYKPVNMFWGQDFDVKGAKESKHSYILYSPLRNMKNATRVIKNGQKITNKKIKPARKGPSQSATLFDEGKRKRGNDGNWWVVSLTKKGVKRWTKHK